MIRRKEAGRRYLAGLVIAGALVHLGAIAFAAFHEGRSGDHDNALSGFLIAGAVPAIIAIFLGQRAWSTRDDSSALYAAGGLVVLLIGAILARFTVLE